MVTCLKLNLLHPIIITYSTKLKLLGLKCKIPQAFWIRFPLPPDTFSPQSHFSGCFSLTHPIVLQSFHCIENGVAILPPLWGSFLSFMDHLKCHQFQVPFQESWLIDCNVPTVLPYDLEHPYLAFFSLPQMPPRVSWQGLIHCFILSMDRCLTHAGHSRLGMSIFFRHAKIDLYPIIYKLLPIIPFDVGEQLRALEPGRSVCVCVCVCVCVWARAQLYLFVIPWTIAHQVLLSRGFSREEYWSGLPFPSPEDLPDPGIKPTSLESPALADRYFTTASPGKSF